MPEEETIPTYYAFNTNGEFVHAAVAEPNPLESGKYLIPARATLLPPPEVAENEVAIFVDDEWNVAPDHRGETVTVLGEDVVIKEIGKTPADYSPSAAEQAAYDEFLVEQQRLEIKIQLEEIDRKTIRPLRAGETTRVAELEAEAVVLRQQLAAIE